MERKIGEIFTDGDLTLKVAKDYHGCSGCFYDNVICTGIKHIRGFCLASDREDNTAVIFIKHNPNEP